MGTEKKPALDKPFHYSARSQKVQSKYGERPVSTYLNSAELSPQTFPSIVPENRGLNRTDRPEKITTHFIEATLQYISSTNSINIKYNKHIIFKDKNIYKYEIYIYHTACSVTISDFIEDAFVICLLSKELFRDMGVKPET